MTQDFRTAVVAKKGLALRMLVGLAALAIGVVTPLVVVAGSPGAAVPAVVAAPSAGSVLGWGNNFHGYLGNGTTTGPDTCESAPGNACNPSPTAATLPAGTVATSVTSSHFSSLAITGSGSLLAWGDNTDGQLGIGTPSGSSATPVPVHLPAATIVTADATGHEFDLALTNTGQVYAWGYNGLGQLGQGNTTTMDTPVPVTLPLGANAVAIAAGHDTSYALTSTGMVYAWGDNEFGQLGIGNDTGPTSCGGTPCATAPTAVTLAAGAVVTSLASTGYHAIVLTSAGAVLTWGYNQDGQLGVGNDTGPDTCGASHPCSTAPVPVTLPAGVVVKSVTAGHYSSLVLTTSGTVYAWGANGEGQLGIGNTTGQFSPTAVPMPAGVSVVELAASGYHVLALTATGQVYAWGQNGDGELGQGSTTGPDSCGTDPCSKSPIAVPMPGGATVSSVAAGNYFSLAVVGAPPGHGYWLVASDGGVFTEGNVPFFGSLGSLTLNKPIVGMAATPYGLGYWLVASDGGVFTEGNAQFYGSLGGKKLNAPIVGMAPTPDGGGYWLVASDGGVFAEGDALFWGSAGAMHLNKPVVGMAATPTGLGYWLVASDGGIFNYGDAKFFGSTGAMHLNKPVVGMASTPTGLGYWLVASDGGVFNYGDAKFYGSTGNLVLNKPVVGMAATPSGLGYWLVASDGGIFNYGDGKFFGSTGNLVLNKPVVGMAAP